MLERIAFKKCYFPILNPKHETTVLPSNSRVSMKTRIRKSARRRIRPNA